MISPDEGPSAKCPACLIIPAGVGFAGLARHLEDQGHGGHSAHVRWLNQNITRRAMPAGEMEPKLREFFDLGGAPLSQWIRRRFIAKFFGPRPHPFVAALQHPSRATLLGYVLEHQHFLRQWVRSCGYILARSDRDEVIAYELDNLTTEFGGRPGQPAHYELLLRMGESLGMSRERILSTVPLESTRAAIEEWHRIAREEPWVEALAAMHSLELIAHRDLVREGATVHYFDPAILKGSDVTEASKAFLREGYEADVGHSDQALGLVDRYATTTAEKTGVQATFLRSIDLFDDYLIARLERGSTLED